ncbi:MAG: hypothetical protein KF757_14375 [Phycisphaeraceae bacterium]|nr:hypothetical protein [Phycisphaeraceae bacterium]MCW5762934.1 hypothetical protein [Phycisphaeraceae bacterium]
MAMALHGHDGCTLGQVDAWDLRSEAGYAVDGAGPLIVAMQRHDHAALIDPSHLTVL